MGMGELSRLKVTVPERTPTVEAPYTAQRHL